MSIIANLSQAIEETVKEIKSERELERVVKEMNDKLLKEYEEKFEKISYEFPWRWDFSDSDDSVTDEGSLLDRDGNVIISLGKTYEDCCDQESGYIVDEEMADFMLTILNGHKELVNLLETWLTVYKELKIELENNCKYDKFESELIKSNLIEEIDRISLDTKTDLILHKFRKVTV